MTYGENNLESVGENDKKGYREGYNILRHPSRCITFI